jgi:regulator of vacuolar morphogenesis
LGALTLQHPIASFYQTLIMDRIESIMIKSAENRKEPKPHVVYKVEIFGNLRCWTVYKRYSEFDALNSAFKKLWPDVPPPAALPPKSFFTNNDETNIRIRKAGLDSYLNILLTCSDDRWRTSSLWEDFLNFKKTSKPTSAIKHSDSNWLDEQLDLNNVIHEIKTILAYRDRLAANGEPCDDQNIQARKLLANLSQRLILLGDSLNSSDTIKSLSEGELIRRKQLCNELKNQKDSLSSRINSRFDVLTKHSSSFQSSSSSSPFTGRRAFGAAATLQETEETLQMDNNQLLLRNDDMMKEQDNHLDSLLNVVVRQKEIGLAINDELELQNSRLKKLESKVDLVSSKMKNAGKAIKKIT